VAPHMHQQVLHQQHHVQQHGVQQHVRQHAQSQPQHQVQQQQQQHQPPGTSGGIVNPSWARSPHGATSAVTAGAISGPAAKGQAPPVVVRRMRSQGSAANLPGLPPFAQPQDPRPAMGAIPVPMTQVSSMTTTPTTTPRLPTPLHRPPTSEIHVEAGAASAPPGGEALYREVDALRHTLAMQEQRISDLTMELQTSREGGTQLASEVESARSELSGLIQELQVERAARERAETFMAEQQQVLSGPPASGRRGSRDEVEPRLREFIEKTKCGLIFRQLNRGWYAFRRADDKGPQSNDRHVSISIINGKLMVTLEPSTHDPGWNFGKPGPIEKFVAKHFEE